MLCEVHAFFVELALICSICYVSNRLLYDVIVVGDAIAWHISYI